MKNMQKQYEKAETNRSVSDRVCVNVSPLCVCAFLCGMQVYVFVCMYVRLYVCMYMHVRVNISVTVFHEVSVIKVI